MNNAFVGNTRHFLDDEIECDPVLPRTIRPALTKQSDSEDLLLSVSRCSFQEVCSGDSNIIIFFFDHMKYSVSSSSFHPSVLQSLCLAYNARVLGFAAIMSDMSTFGILHLSTSFWTTWS